MREPTDAERKLFQAQQEIITCGAISVNRADTGDLGEVFDSAPELFSYLPDWEGVNFSRDLCVNSPRISEIANCWYSESFGPADFGGEFRVTDLFTAVLKHAPELAWPGSTDEERELFSQLRVIDDTPLAATGQLAAVRVQAIVDPWEVWYYDMELNKVAGWDRQYVQLDLTYPAYMEQLAITKGTFGWQYLFADDVALGHPDFEHVKSHLTTMLQEFPRLFPAWDYADLSRRLEARL
ncbi:hypothetical protein [Streptomyces sp. NBC_01304]|uniref:hypothetical protein n=1 Tax=Streptomyces sp. NBC_01304 TaxID=2903818 RepID=UPI002E0E545F|nr:hypothetical protein OG430_08510 [Streptomyces sp. NBC_01304]